MTVCNRTSSYGIRGTWIDPTGACPDGIGNAAGNMISGPKAGDESTRLHYVYDAWNRLAAARDKGGYLPA